jgi:hypothetical protein
MAAVKNESGLSKVGVLPAEIVKLIREPAQVPVPFLAKASDPHVELVRDAAGAIQAIDVTCSCGKRMRLRCVY